jgi:hypothetical protein
MGCRGFYSGEKHLGAHHGGQAEASRRVDLYIRGEGYTRPKLRERPCVRG